MDTHGKEAFSNSIPHIPILSSTTGEPISAKSSHELLRIILKEILMSALCWDKVLEGCTSILQPAGAFDCSIFPVATVASQGLITALKRHGVSNITVENGIVETLNEKSGENVTGRAEKSKIAIIGLSGRFPDADSPELFWELLHKGLDVHREVPPDRWDVKAHVDLTGKTRNTSQVPYGCWIKEPGLFDSRFFNMSPREAMQVDPGQRLALATAYEALEMAGLVPDSTPSTQRDRIGMFYGMTSDDYREVNSGQDVDTYFIPGGNRAFTPGRINYYFRFSGPSISVDTACSSSLAAIHMACNSLWRNDCDTALAGGTNVLTNPDNFAGLDRGHFLSRTGNCNTFDDGADGYCRADCVGTVILKRLEDAQADKDPILGVIVGVYTNHSAEAVSMTRPHVGAQAFIFDKLLNEADVNPHEISYIEMHGTGTQAGDAVEMKSVLDVFAPDYRRKPEHSLYLGSAKANIGHAESASGVASLIKVLLMMQQNTIPPHCGIKTKINHTFPTDLGERNVHIALKPTPWTRQGSTKRKVFLNNFSAAGGNTAVLLEDAPLKTENTEEDARSTHIITLSARCQSSLKRNILSLLDYISRSAPGAREESFAAKLSYTTTARRIHHPFRIAASGRTVKDICKDLKLSLDRESISPAPATQPGVGFVFTGQGAQYSGMGKELYESCAQFKDNIQRFDSMCQNQGFCSILPLIDGTVASEDLTPLVIQLGTVCLQMALARLWISWGVKPSFVLGHSLGEYPALYISGVLTSYDTIFLSGRRALLLEEMCQQGTHSMLAVKSSIPEIKHFLEDAYHEVACANSPGESVISGRVEHIESLAELLGSKGIKSTKLRVPFAFHSSQVDPIQEKLFRCADGIIFHKPTIPIVSSLLAEVISEANYDKINPTYVIRHCRETVNFIGAIEASRHAKLSTEKTVWVEVGSHTICSSMIKSTLGPHTKTVASLRRGEDVWAVLCSSLASLYLAGFEINWKEYHQDFKPSQEVLPLPAYSWDNKNHWIYYKNNFCLTKGETEAAKVSLQQGQEVFRTTSVQKILEARGDGQKATVVGESDIADPLLNAVIKGHKVNGAALCPSVSTSLILKSLELY